MNNRKSGVIALITAVILGVVVLGASVFISENAEHSCDGPECLVCAAIEQCENILNSPGLAAAAVLLLTTVSVAYSCSVKMTERHFFRPDTLITLKAELLN